MKKWHIYEGFFLDGLSENKNSAFKRCYAIAYKTGARKETWEITKGKDFIDITIPWHKTIRAVYMEME